MAIDLKALSPKELQSLIANAEAHMQEAKVTQIQDVRKKIDTLLNNAGLTLADIYPTHGGKTKAGKRSVVAPKYRNPEDASQTWSGRGKRPLWVVAALKRRGVTLDSLLIDGAGKGNASAKRSAKKATGRSVVAPKYRNPEDASQTWSGRGKRPLWVVAALKRRGVTIDSLLIDGASKGGKPAKRSAKKATRRKARRG
jgi:DNA-binding protein H-NS